MTRYYIQVEIMYADGVPSCVEGRGRTLREAVKSLARDFAYRAEREKAWYVPMRLLRYEKSKIRPGMEIYHTCDNFTSGVNLDMIAGVWFLLYDDLRDEIDVFRDAHYRDTPK